MGLASTTGFVSGVGAEPSSRALAQVDAHERRELSADWQAARTSVDLHADTAGIEALNWIPARVPGTAAAALRDAGEWRLGDRHDFDAEDWWFRTSFPAAEPLAPGEEAWLCLEGIATVAEVYLNGELVLESDSMFAAHALDVTGRLRERAQNELAIRCRALGPLLAVRRRPRARWRTRLVDDGNLRFFRTMLLGRMPGLAPGPPAVGPWRAVALERRRRVDVGELTLRTRLDGEGGADGVLSVRVRLRPLDGTEVSAVEVELSGPSGAHRARLALAADRDPGIRDSDSGEATGASGEKPGDSGEQVTASGELRVPGVARWWPHTHGEPALHDVRLVVVHGTGEDEQTTIDAGRVGFRDLAFGSEPGPGHDVEQDGLDLYVNGVQVFARGAVWTPIDPIGHAPSDDELRAELMRVRDAGMNMLRLPGTGAYETGAFHDLCDELGILLWQDFMFANLDYPLADERFRESVTREAADVLAALGARPSLAVLCGNSEVEQQATMMGIDASLARGELFGELLPELVRASGVDALYIPSAPYGGDLPFRPGQGIGTYYAVGCYRLPLEDVRRAGVRFAAECLAFSHVPPAETIEEMLPSAPARLAGHHQLWKAGVPRENEADWDFEDIRDHYLRLLYGVDAVDLRHVDRARYLELSRMLTGEILAEVFGEWRRAGSPCGGGLVLWLHDPLPGAGWGLVDHRGRAKLAYHHLARALAPVAVWSTDENLGGVVAHVANDRPAPLRASLRVALYREGEQCVEQASVPVELAPHSRGEWNVEAVIGHFVDAAWAYKFGSPATDAIVVTLERAGNGDNVIDSAGEATHEEPRAEEPASEESHGEASAGNPPSDQEGPQRLISQTFRFPAGRPLEREPAERLGLTARGQALPDGSVRVTVSSRRLAYGVEVHAPGFTPSDAGFSIEPGGERMVMLGPGENDAVFAGGKLTAVNLQGRVSIVLDEAS
jgi:beta-mannosidase